MTSEPRTAAGRALPRPMDWYKRKSDDELLYGYLLSPAEIAAIEAEAAEPYRKALGEIAVFLAPEGRRWADVDAALEIARELLRPEVGE